MQWFIFFLAGMISFSSSSSDLYRQSRDSQRLSDLGALKGAITLYLVTAEYPRLCTDKNKVYQSDKGTGAVDGTGWLPVNLTKTTGGSPIARLPKDPTNSKNFIYYYACDPNAITFELNAKMENTRYQNSGEDDVESTDAGDNPKIYETGTSPGFKLIKNE